MSAEDVAVRGARSDSRRSEVHNLIPQLDADKPIEFALSKGAVLMLTLGLEDIQLKFKPKNRPYQKVALEERVAQSQRDGFISAMFDFQNQVLWIIGV